MPALPSFIVNDPKSPSGVLVIRNPEHSFPVGQKNPVGGGGGGAGLTVTVAESDLLVSAADVPRTVTTVCAVTVGAVKSPEELIVPVDAVHVTAVFEEPTTVAVNCTVWPE